MNYLKIAFGVLIVLSASRFIPHPPNFTSLVALSFYIPAAFGIRYIPAVLLSFYIHRPNNWISFLNDLYSR